MTDRVSCIEVDSPAGKILLAATKEGLTHLLFADENGRPLRATSRPQSDTSPEAAGILDAAQVQLAEYFAGRRQDFDLPLAPHGTDFQRAVWRGLRDIPFGETVSYRDLARRIGRLRAVRAVGAANGANPISIIMPCHRVIGQDRRLVGYGGGLAVKKLLLELEGLRVDGERLV